MYNREYPDKRIVSYSQTLPIASERKGLDTIYMWYMEMYNREYPDKRIVSHSQIQNSFDQSQCLSFHPLVQEVNEICSPRSSIIHVALSGYQISLTFRKRHNGERLKNKLLNKIILWKSVPFRTLGHIY